MTDNGNITSLHDAVKARGLKYSIETYGCQMNAHESEKLAGILEAAGFVHAEESWEADIIMFNTCCVREHAEQRLSGNVGALKKRKAENRDLIIGVCGCMMQQEGVAEKFMRRFEFVDIVFGTKSMHRLPEMLYCAVVLKKRSCITDDGDSIIEDIPITRNTPPLSFVSIMQGCNNFCSYCIVPYVRGRERSRTPDAVIAEVKSLAQAGYKEVMLLGQNVNSYGAGTDTDFPELLTRVAEETGMPRIRFMTSHPKDASPELIRVMSEHDNICKSLHLPLQSGSNDVLLRMNRRYTIERYMELIDGARERIPGLFLSTDLIVGFPGETERDFEDTLDAVRRARFDAAYTFVYSRRTGTKAAEMDGQISREVKQSRIMRLIELQTQLTYESNLSCVGNTYRVLVEGRSKRDAGECCGRTDEGRMVNFKGQLEPGDFADIRITDAKRTTIFGETAEK